MLERKPGCNFVLSSNDVNAQSLPIIGNVIAEGELLQSDTCAIHGKSEYVDAEPSKSSYIMLICAGSVPIMA